MEEEKEGHADMFDFTTWGADAPSAPPSRYVRDTSVQLNCRARLRLPARLLVKRDVSDIRAERRSPPPPY